MWTCLLLLAFNAGCETPLAPALEEGALSGVPVAAAPRGDVTRPVKPTSPAGLIEDERNTISVFEAAAPATVFVTQRQRVRDWHTRRTVEVESGTGSGFLWDNQGHVVTNYHVVADGRGYEVTLHDRTTWPATLVGGDPRKDIAVLKIQAPAESLTAIRLPDPDDALQVGQKAVAIGNPFGLDHTMTVGIISAIGRDVPGYGGVTIQDMIQTDASINPGNSGGPLLNSRGELLGMNTMIYSQSGSSAGIGFAVPVKTIRRIVPQIIEHGRPIQVGIGVSLIDDSDAQRVGVDGVIIEKIVPGSPAETAGLIGLRATQRGVSIGDVIVAVEDKEVHGYDDLYTALDERQPGEEVTFTVLRDGETRKVQITLYELR